MKASINQDIPIELFPDDVFLVSYPKSGRTWLRFLIANYLSGNKSDFTNSHLIVPDIDYNPQQCSKIQRPRFIQSHWPFTPAFSRVVYIVRDGRDVAVSYYFHMLKFRIIDKETRFDDFLVNFNKGCLDNFTAWSDHVNLWVDNQPQDFLLVKYEDMKANTVGELIRILEFAGLGVDEDAVVGAVEASGFEKMKNLENTQSKLLDVLANTDLSMKFVRQGKVAEYVNYFNDELLIDFIDIHGSALRRLGYLTEPDSSLDIRHSYTNEYYTQDCGGFDAYNKNRGKDLEDLRLQAVASIASAKRQGRVLDLGCGRGELTYYFVKQGFEVKAVDYSQNAIELAKTCFDGEEQLKEKVQFYCESVCTIPLIECYDLAIASDLIEHLSFDELEQLYQRVSQHLKPDGLFVIHTFPNLWYYQYEYPRRRKAAAAVGLDLPAQPRTRYERLMHINEQSPRVLKRQLSKHFEEVLLWFGDPENPGGSLLREFSSSEMRAATSIFALASHQAINIDQVKAYLQMTPLPPIPEGKLQLRVTATPNQATVGSKFDVDVEINNNSNFIFNSYKPNPVNIAYHWMDEFGTTSLIFDGERSKILPSLEAMAQNSYRVRIESPEKSGKYILRLTLVQEGVRWFDQAPTNVAVDITVVIK